MRAPSRRTASLLAVLALTVTSTLGATASAMAQSNPLCSPLVGCGDSDKPDESKKPTPSAPTAPDDPTQSPIAPVDPTQSPTDPTEPEPTETETPSDEPTPEPTETETPSEEPKEPVEATRDDDAPVFTETPASMGSESLSFTGLRGIAIVSVPTADGGSTRALKISADSITIEGFSLTVTPPDEPGGGLVTLADTMTLEGDVEVYIGSITATTKDGHSLTIGTKTPPPLDDVEPGLLRVTMGLVGTTADSIKYSNTDQQIVES